MMLVYAERICYQHPFHHPIHQIRDYTFDAFYYVIVIHIIVLISCNTVSLT